MKNTDIKIARKGFLFNCSPHVPGSHCALALSLGRGLPVTLSQLRKFYAPMDLLSADDADLIQKIFSKYGKIAEFRYSKSKAFVRLQNWEEFRVLLKKDIALNNGMLSPEFCIF